MPEDRLMPEETLQARMAAEGLNPSAWGNGPGDRYAPHRHDFDKVIVVAAGSIVFELPDLPELPVAGRSIELTTGDRVELPAGTLHAARVGDAGVTCLEAHLKAGMLPQREPRLEAGWGREVGAADAGIETPGSATETVAGPRT
jgi:hypothetical protein